MNWTRYKLLIISGGIALIVSGGLIFWIMSTRSKNSEVDSQIQNLESTQTRLYSQKPYPSDINFEQLKSEQAKVIEQRDAMKKLIREGQLQPDTVGRAYFGEYIAKWVANLRNAAKASTKGAGEGVVLADPDFGLTDYLQGLPPENAKLPGLLQDLGVIKHLSLLLFDSGISELVVVKRVEEDVATGRRRNSPANLNEFAGFGANPMGGPPVNQPAATEDLRSKVVQEKDRLFEWKDYRVEFRAYEDFLWETLNKMIADPNQFVLKELYVTNSNQILWPKGLEPVLGSEKSRTPRTRAAAPRREMSEMERLLMGGGDSTGSQAVEEAKVQRAGLEERNQNVIGADLLNVVMVVRVYRLTEETQETEEGL